MKQPDRSPSSFLIGGDPVIDVVARIVLKHFPQDPFVVSPRDFRIGGAEDHLRQARRMVAVAVMRLGVSRKLVADRLGMSTTALWRAAEAQRRHIAASPDLRRAWTAVCNEIDTIGMIAA